MSQGLALTLQSPFIQQYTDRAAELVSRLEQLGQLDFSTGAAQIDEKGLNEFITKFFPPDMAPHIYGDLIAVARGGFAVFGSNQEIKSKKAGAIPWASLTSLSQMESDLPDGLLPNLGITAASTIDTARAELQKRFPKIPNNIVDDTTLKILIEDAINEAARRLEEDYNVRRSVPLRRTLAARSSNNAAQCLLDGVWEVHWWGWSCCLDQNCANTVADMLGSPRNISILVEAAKKLLEEGAKAALKVVIGSALTVIVLYGLALALNILAVNGPKGVCLQGNWPTPFAGAFVWAVKR